MVRSLNTLAFFVGLVAALPAPTPIVTPGPDLTKRQDTSPEACTITFNPATTFYNEVLDVDDAGNIKTVTDTISIPAGNGCNCADGVIAGISETIGIDGQTTQFCAAGETSTRTAESTRVAEPTPGAPDNAGWAQVQCDDGSLTDIFNNPWEQWNDSGAAGAWNSMMENWNHAPDDEKASLSNFLGNYFKTAPATHCESLGEGSCDDTITCGQNFQGQQTTTPAGYVIFNSFVSLHNMFLDIMNGINSGLDAVDGKMGQFVETFSPINEDIEDQKRKKIAYDIAQACMFGVLAPTFHSGFSRSSWVQRNPNFVAAGFDFTYGMIGTSFALAKDSMDALSTLPVQNELTAFMVDTARSWGKAIQDAAKNILNDPDNAFAFIDQGKFFPGDTPADPVEAGEYVEKSMLAAALSAVWVTGDPSKHAPPVIVTSDGVPQDGSGCDSYKPEDWDEGDLTFEDDVLDGARACVGDTAYWLMGARQGGNEGTCLVPGTSFPSQCPDKGILLEPLYNIDKLGDFGLSLDEVVGNAVNSWAANGNKNGWDPLQLAEAEGEEIGELIEQHLGNTKGIVKIPVCSFSELVEYLNEVGDSDGADNPNHPCPP